MGRCIKNIPFMRIRVCDLCYHQFARGLAFWHVTIAWIPLDLFLCVAVCYVCTNTMYWGEPGWNPGEYEKQGHVAGDQREVVYVVQLMDNDYFLTSLLMSDVGCEMWHLCLEQTLASTQRRIDVLLESEYNSCKRWVHPFLIIGDSCGTLFALERSNSFAPPLEKRLVNVVKRSGYCGQLYRL